MGGFKKGEVKFDKVVSSRYYYIPCETFHSKKDLVGSVLKGECKGSPMVRGCDYTVGILFKME